MKTQGHGYFDHQEDRRGLSQPPCKENEDDFDGGYFRCHCHKRV